VPAAITAAGPISPLKSLAIQFIGVPVASKRGDSTLRASRRDRWLQEAQQNRASDVTFPGGSRDADRGNECTVPRLRRDVDGMLTHPGGSSERREDVFESTQAFTARTRRTSLTGESHVTPSHRIRLALLHRAVTCGAPDWLSEIGVTVQGG
jgi:hypothetical protein